MRSWKWLGLVIVLISVSVPAFAQNDDLQYFLAKGSSKESALSASDRTRLFSSLDDLLDRCEKIRLKLVQRIQAGEVDFLYQEATFWLAKLKEDGASIEITAQQIKVLREKSGLLVPSIRLYKSLKDLSENFAIYNNMSSFSAVVGDLAPELDLWVDPVFFDLYLLPLAGAKDKEGVSKPPAPKENPKEKKPVSKAKKP